MLRSWGTFMLTLVEPSTETMPWCSSPSGPGGSSTKLNPWRKPLGPMPVSSVWHVTHSTTSRLSNRYWSRPRTASPFGSGRPGVPNRPVVKCPSSGMLVGSVLSKLRNGLGGKWIVARKSSNCCILARASGARRRPADRREASPLNSSMPVAVAAPVEAVPCSMMSCSVWVTIGPLHRMPVFGAGLVGTQAEVLAVLNDLMLPLRDRPGPRRGDRNARIDMARGAGNVAEPRGLPGVE